MNDIIFVGLDVHKATVAPSLIPVKAGDRVKTGRRGHGAAAAWA